MQRSLRITGIICVNQVRRVLTDRGTPIWLLALPLALIGVLGMSLQPLMSSDFAPSKPFHVVVAEIPGGNHVAVIEALRGLERFLEVASVADPESARELVRHRVADAALISSPGNPAAVTIVAAPGSVVAEVLESAIERILLEITVQRTEGVEIAHTRVDVTDGAGETPPWLRTDAFTYYAAGITAMFVMFAAHAVTVTVATDRATDAYARLRSLGVKPAVYMLGGSLAAVAVAILFVCTVALISALLFGVNWGALGPWTVLTVLGATAAAGLSLVVMALVPNPEHVDSAGSAIYNVLAFLGGSMSPLLVLPEWFRRSFAWLPNRALLDGYLKTSLGAAASEVSAEATTLLVASVVLFALGWTVWSVRGRGEEA